jgi:hypothetical protein
MKFSKEGGGLFKLMVIIRPYLCSIAAQEYLLLQLFSSTWLLLAALSCCVVTKSVDSAYWVGQDSSEYTIIGEVAAPLYTRPKD